MKALGLELKEKNCVQVSMNMTNYTVTSLTTVYRAIQEETGKVPKTPHCRLLTESWAYSSQTNSLRSQLECWNAGILEYWVKTRLPRKLGERAGK